MKLRFSFLVLVSVRTSFIAKSPHGFWGDLRFCLILSQLSARMRLLRYDVQSSLCLLYKTTPPRPCSGGLSSLLKGPFTSTSDSTSADSSSESRPITSSPTNLLSMLSHSASCYPRVIPWVQDGFIKWVWRIIHPPLMLTSKQGQRVHDQVWSCWLLQTIADLFIYFADWPASLFFFVLPTTNARQNRSKLQLSRSLFLRLRKEWWRLYLEASREWVCWWFLGLIVDLL